MAAPSDALLQRLLRARDLIHDAYASPLELEALARAAGLSRYYFLRSFAAAFGEPPRAYLTRVRLEAARRALARGRGVTETCLEVGFESPSTFSGLFARRFGTAPRDWQRSVRQVVAVWGLPEPIWIPACFLAWCAEGNPGEAVASPVR